MSSTIGGCEAEQELVLSERGEQGVCAFCGQTAFLLESHILPAFAYRWLRGRSGTGHIRRSDDPNRRVQDGLKIRMLCASCEAKFSRYETAFVNKIFLPWDNGTVSASYGDWLLKFCVSVSWRVLMFCYGQNKDHIYTDEQTILIREAFTTWKSFLDGETSHPGDYEQHLVIVDNIESTTIDNLPQNINRFLTGAITLDIIGSSVSTMTFAKLGRFIVIGIIQKGPDRWHNTRVHVKHGMLKPGTFKVPRGLLGLIIDKANAAAAAMDSVSSRQRTKIEDAIMKDPDRFVSSGQFTSIEADVRMFGLGAVVRKD